MSGSRNSGWLRSLFSPLMKAAGLSASLSTSMAKAAMTDVMPMVSSAARSAALIISGVICPSETFVKLALNRDESFLIMLSVTETGRCTSLFFTLLLESITTIIKVFASTYMMSKRFIVTVLCVVSASAG